MRMNEKIRVRAINVEDGSIKEYPSMMMCGREFGICSALVKYWVETGNIRNGYKYELIDDTTRNGVNASSNRKKRKCFVEDTDGNMVAEYDSILLMANAYGITSSTARYRVFTGKVYNGLVFKLKDKDAQIPIPKLFTKKKVDYKKNTELDIEKYAILKYETKHHICITPCPYFESPKPMIGSGRCLNCSCFRGRNQETQEIACNKSLR